jgi:hypothetical protein
MILMFFINHALKLDISTQLFEDVSYSMIKYDADKYNSPLKLE